LALDPRVKKRITEEATAESAVKAARDRKKLAKRLVNQLREQKITEEEGQNRLTQHDEIWKNKTLNEIAKRIERAHLYSFNLSGYRSNLSKRQLEEWDSAFNGTKRTNGKSLDKRFGMLVECPPNNSHPVLALFEVRNNLEFDIVRQYLMAFSSEELAQYNQLVTLRQIIESGAGYPRVQLRDILEPKNDRIKKEDFDGQYDIIEKISFADGQIYVREFPETGMDLYLAEKGDLITSKINLHQGAVALAPRRLACSTHYQVYRSNSAGCRNDFLLYVLRSRKFISQLVEQKNKGIKNEQGIDFLLNFEIPLPPIEIQESVGSRLEAFVNCIEGCKTVAKWFTVDIPEIESDSHSSIGEAVVETKNGWSPRCDGGPLQVLKISCLKNGQIDYSETKNTNHTRSDISDFYVREGDFFYSRGNGNPQLVALSAIAGPADAHVIFPDLLTRVVFDPSLLMPQFAVLLFNCSYGRRYFSAVHKGAVSMAKVSQKYMMDFPVPFLGDIQQQHKILSKYMPIIETIRAIPSIRIQAEQAMDNVLDKLWR
jgi:restriction endonuclease S subunit